MDEPEYQKPLLDIPNQNDDPDKEDEEIITKKKNSNIFQLFSALTGSKQLKFSVVGGGMILIILLTLIWNSDRDLRSDFRIPNFNLNPDKYDDEILKLMKQSAIQSKQIEDLKEVIRKLSYRLEELNSSPFPGSVDSFYSLCIMILLSFFISFIMVSFRKYYPKNKMDLLKILDKTLDSLLNTNKNNNNTTTIVKAT